MSFLTSLDRNDVLFRQLHLVTRVRRVSLFIGILPVRSERLSLRIPTPGRTSAWCRTQNFRHLRSVAHHSCGFVTHIFGLVGITRSITPARPYRGKSATRACTIACLGPTLRTVRANTRPLALIDCRICENQGVYFG